MPAGAVNTVPQAFAQPHVAHRGMLVEQDGHRAPGIPVKLSETPGGAGPPPPRFGEHAAKYWPKPASIRRHIDGLIATGVQRNDEPTTKERKR